MSNDLKVLAELELTVDQAWELAQVLKRMTLMDYRLLTTDNEKAYDALNGGQCVIEALAKVGIDPR